MIDVKDRVLLNGNEIWNAGPIFGTPDGSIDKILGIDENNNLVKSDPISGSDLPSGTENQTLRYNSSNELEATNAIQVFDNSITIGDRDEQSLPVKYSVEMFAERNVSLLAQDPNDSTNSTSVNVINRGMGGYNTNAVIMQAETNEFYIGDVNSTIGLVYKDKTTGDVKFHVDNSGTLQINDLDINNIDVTNDTYIGIGSNHRIKTMPDPSTLPTGTVSQTLRHNGTTWVANSHLKVNPMQIDGLGLIGISNRVIGSNQTRAVYVDFDGGDTGIGIQVNNYLTTSSIATNRIGIVVALPNSASKSYGTSYFSDNLFGGYHFRSNVFSVDYVGKIKSSYLAGNGTKPLIADNDGVISKSTYSQTITKEKDITLTAVTSTIPFNDDELGIGSSLLDVTMTIQCYYWNGSAWLDMRDYTPQITDEYVNIAFNNSKAIGDRFKIVVSYAL